MRVTVVSFAQAREVLSSGELSLELPDGSTVRDALAAMERTHPALAALRPVLATAVNGELVHAGTALIDGGELALLPPVSGG